MPVQLNECRVKRLRMQDTVVQPCPSRSHHHSRTCNS